MLAWVENGIGIENGQKNHHLFVFSRFETGKKPVLAHLKQGSQVFGVLDPQNLVYYNPDQLFILVAHLKCCRKHLASSCSMKTKP